MEVGPFRLATSRSVRCTFDNNGSVGGPNDAFGFGFYPGQFGMVVYSRFPILREQARTFQKFLWKDMPDALLPDDPATPEPNDWYSPEELAVFRLSSKSHWDLPIAVHGKVIHVLTSHPTPPVFDGPEDRNGRRDNERIKGIGLWFAHINGVLPAPSEYECNVYQVDTATYEWEACDDSAPTSSGQPVNVREKVSARTNCGAWNPVVECEPAKIASAVRVHVSTDDEIVGLALACDSAVFEQ